MSKLKLVFVTLRLILIHCCIDFIDEKKNTLKKPFTRSFDMFDILLINIHHQRRDKFTSSWWRLCFVRFRLLRLIRTLFGRAQIKIWGPGCNCWPSNIDARWPILWTANSQKGDNEQSQSWLFPVPDSFPRILGAHERKLNICLL